MPLSKKLKIFSMRKSEGKSQFLKVKGRGMPGGKGIGSKSNSVLSPTTKIKPTTKVLRLKTQPVKKLHLAIGRLMSTFFYHMSNVKTSRLRLQFVRNAKILN